MKRQKRDSSQAPLRQRKVGFLFRFLAMIAVALAVFCCITLFFQVEEITVRGNHLYTDEQVADASGISMGDNMVSIQKAGAASLIRSTLPFIQKVHIERQLPGTVRITVTETDVTFAVRAQDTNYYLINSSGQLTAEIQTVHASDYPNLEGITVTLPQVGKVISVPESEAVNANAAMELIGLLIDYGVAGSVTELNVKEAHNIVLNYGNQYEIRLGNTENLAYKVEYLVAVLMDLQTQGNTRGGIIDLSFTVEDTARFEPY